MGDGGPTALQPPPVVPPLPLAPMVPLQVHPAQQIQPAKMPQLNWSHLNQNFQVNLMMMMMMMMMMQKNISEQMTEWKPMHF